MDADGEDLRALALLLDKEIEDNLMPVRETDTHQEGE
jgi:hypothetical protein